MRGVAEALRNRVNPVLDRELRQRLRGRSAWVSLTIYLIVLGLILRVVFDQATAQNVFGASQVQAAAGAGRSIFHWMLFVMLGLICFIVPGLTAGAIAGERERQTLIPLQITLLSPRSIVVGKLLASVAFVVLLVIAALPFLSVSFLLGGVAASEVMKGVGMVLVIALSIAALSLACSAAARRTQTATVTSYAIVGLLVIGTLAFYGAQRALDTSPTGSSRPTILLLNPFAATAEVIRGRSNTSELSSPFTPFQDIIATDAFHGATVSVDSGDSGIIQRGPGGLIAPVPMPMPVPIPATTIPMPSPTAPPTAAVPRAPGEPPPATATGVLFSVEGPVKQIAQVGQIEPDGPVDLPGSFGPGQFAQLVDPEPRIGGLPFWLASLCTFLILAFLGLLVAVRKVAVPARGRAE